MTTPGITKTVQRSYDEVLEQLPDALKSEGFGVLTQIDLKETLKAKLGVEFRRYKILGACNPTFAYQALQADLGAGVMLPCNVLVYEDGDRTVVTAVDPMSTFAAEHDTLKPIAEQVRDKLARVIERL
ncbi:MAG TPA: DUF302 domain-containing protein [Kofleriaceae bacterium]|nr:DUF302 domain-containing protein [Kofleriaceae bacterium]